MTVSFRSALLCAGLGLVMAAPALARNAAPLPAAVIAIPAGSSGFIDINLAGWTSFGDLGNPNNTLAAFDIGAGTVVTGFSYEGVTFTTSNGSWLSELTLSVNPTNGDPETEFMDWSPSTVDNSGTATALAGSWDGASGQPGGFGIGSSFAAADGLIYVTVYESFDDPFGSTGPGLLDATITAGTMRVFLAPVPEPGTYGMMALGLLAIGATMRKRQSSR
jgi:PEP-CTERM motif